MALVVIAVTFLLRDKIITIKTVIILTRRLVVFFPT